MEFALILRELSKRRRALAIGVSVAVLAAVFSVYRLDGIGLKSRSLQYSSATTTVFVDTPSSVLGNITQSFEPLQARATAYANFMASPTVLNLIGQQVGIAGDQIYAAGPIDPAVPRIVQEPTAVQRNVEITGETTPYRLNFNNDPNLPTIGIYAQAPTTKQSIGLANAAAASLAQYVSNIQTVNQTPSQSRVVVRQLGPATGGVVDGGISKALACIAFLGVFLFWCVMTLVVVRFRQSWRESGVLTEMDDSEANGRQLAVIDLDSRETHNGAAKAEIPKAEIRNGNGQSTERRPDLKVGAVRANRIRPSGTS